MTEALCKHVLFRVYLSDPAIPVFSSFVSFQEVVLAKKRDIVLKVHPYKIAQGMGKDRRWFTYVKDQKALGKRKKVGKKPAF